MEHILELQSVCKTFPKTQFALDQVSFSIPYGSIMGFVGANGAGKTTTIGCILNTVLKDRGTIRLFGQELSDAGTKAEALLPGHDHETGCRRGSVTSPAAPDTGRSHKRPGSRHA